MSGTPVDCVLACFSVAGYVTLDFGDIRRLGEVFGVAVKRAELLPGGKANSSYVVGSDGHPLLLTVHTTSTPEEVRRVSALVSAVASAGVEVPQYLAVPDTGDVVTEWHGHAVSLRPYVPGISEVESPREHVADAGRLLARLHFVSPPPGTPQASTWAPADRIAGVEEVAAPSLRQWLRDRFDETAAVGELMGPAGFVHGDYWPDNVVVTSEGRVVPIDFEDAAHGLFLGDLGCALTGFPVEGGTFNPGRARSFIEGYEGVRPLAEQERRHIAHATVRAGATIVLGRFWRHHVRFPDPRRHDAHLSVLAVTDQARETACQWAA